MGTEAVWPEGELQAAEGSTRSAGGLQMGQRSGQFRFEL